MMKVKGIFAVSFIAMVVVGGAYADIASSGYVDEKIDGLAAASIRLLRMRLRTRRLISLCRPKPVN